MPYSKQCVRLALRLFVFVASSLGCSTPDKEATVLPALTLTPTQAVFQQTSFDIDRSALSYGVFETEATSLTIEVSNTVPDQFGDFVDISVEDGSGLTTYEVQPGPSTILHSMRAGKKLVTVTSGLQTKFRNKIVGVFIDRIAFDKSAIPIEQEDNRVVIYGDSLAVGGNVDHLSAEAWPVLLRKHYPVLIEGYGYRALYEDASTTEARSDLASKISSWSPDDVWLAIGVNDYAFGLWPASEFGEAYGATLDAIQAASPQAVLFAQSPILQADEPANRFGDTLENYRQQIANVCLARSAWCVFVDGTDPAFPQPDELDIDGIHLTTKSSAKYAQAVLDLLRK
jgi:lysophospholipase L1-like esterase